MEIKDLRMRVMEIDDIKPCLDFVNSAFEKNMLTKGPVQEENDINSAPWSWYGLPEIWFSVVEFNSRVIAYCIVRRVGGVAHLHSIVVEPGSQGKGIGAFIMERYPKEHCGNKSLPCILTLHSYTTTDYNHEFYLKYGFKLYVDNDEKIFLELNEWISNCNKHHDWPLTNKKILFFKIL